MTFLPPPDTYLMPYGLTSRVDLEEGRIYPTLVTDFPYWTFDVEAVHPLCTSVSRDMIRWWPRTSNESRCTGLRRVALRLRGTTYGLYRYYIPTV